MAAKIVVSGIKYLTSEQPVNYSFNTRDNLHIFKKKSTQINQKFNISLSLHLSLWIQEIKLIQMVKDFATMKQTVVAISL